MSDESDSDSAVLADPPVFGGGVTWNGPLNAQERSALATRPMPSFRPAPPQLRGNRVTQQEFCEVVAQTGNFATACLAIGCTRGQMERLRKSDPDFDEAVRSALDAFAAQVEGEIVRRAMEGVEKPIISMGRVVAVQKEFSDSMLMALIRKVSPEWRAALQGGSGTTVNVTASAHAGAQALASGTPESLPDRIRALPAAQRDALRAALQALAPSSAAQLTGPPEPRQGQQEGQEQGEATLDVEPGAETKLGTP